MIKRLCDFCLAASGLIASFPLSLLFALAVKLEDGGPIFYTQERWGKNGKKFRAFKFRSMVPDADKKWGATAAKENDIRITKVGKFLRATAMDELPQLFNIAKGDMSFVGPRALAVGEVPEETPFFKERHQIRPGLTGMAQVYASRDATFEEKFKIDVNYIRKGHLGLDLKLILLSFWITFTGKWESREKKI